MSFQILDKDNVIYASGGMSTEVNFAKYVAFRKQKVYGGWDNNIRLVYPSIIRDTLTRVVNHVKMLESKGCNKTVLHSPGFLSVNYMTELCNFVYLPSQFLVGFNSVRELKNVLTDLKENGIEAYAVAGYDGCIPNCLVAWIKFVKIPPQYQDLIENYLQSDSVLFAGVYSENSRTYGENVIHQYGEPTNTITSENLYFLHIISCYSLPLSEEPECASITFYTPPPPNPTQQDWDIFRKLALDFECSKIHNETLCSYVGDWESAFDISKEKYFPTFMGVIKFAQAIDTKPLYKVSYELSREFMDINHITIQGVVLNPYILNTPTYETNYGYLGYSYWGGNPDLEKELNRDIPQDLPSNGTIWFNDQNSQCRDLYDRIHNIQKVYIDNSSSLSEELTSWINKYKPKQYPRRDFISLKQLCIVLEKCNVIVA